MTRQILAVVAACVLAAGSTWGVGGGVVGVVSDAASGRPIPFATIQVEGSNLGTAADSSGGFALAYVPTGTWEISVSAVGYRTLRATVQTGEDEAHILKIDLEATQVDVGQIVVTGTRTPRYMKDAPVFTEVVSKASIESKVARNIFEALEGESGVRVEQQCQACNFTILRMQGLGADHTQVLLDGQPVYSGLASVYGLQQMSTVDVDRVEIVKGAGSALYGGNAVAGAINVVSSIPRKTEGSVAIEFGEYGTNRYSFTAGTRKDKLSLFLFAQQHEQDEMDETGDASAPGGVDKSDGWTDRVRSTSRNVGFNLFLDNVFAADQLLIRGRLMDETRIGGCLIGDQLENPYSAGTEHVVTDRISGLIEYRTWLPGGTEINAGISLSNHRRNATNDTFLSDYEDAFGTTPPVDLLRPYIAEEDLLVANLNAIKPLGNRHRVLLGAQISCNGLKENGMYLDIETHLPYSSRSKKRAFESGVFLQDEWRATDRLELVGGLRLDHHRSKDEFRGSGDVLPQGLQPLEYEETTVTPRFSIKYSVSDALVLRASTGSGFRVPYGFSEDLHLCSGSPRVYKGGDLKAERSFSHSLTADYTAASATVSINFYRTELKNAIAFAEADSSVAELGYTYQWKNINDAYVTGVEANASVSLASGLVLGARVEVFQGKYQKAREDWLGTPFEDMSRNISRYPQTAGGLKLNITLGNWNLVTDADYKGKMYIDLAEPSDPADAKIHETKSGVTLNAKVSRTLFGRCLVYLGAKNLTDYTQKEKHIEDAAFMYAPVYGCLWYGGVRMSL